MSFLTGFATGFAKSVDTQLQESIQRTRDNIDMVSKWRLKKAEEREVERRKKDREIETLIKDAAYVIGGDANDVNSQNIAAALYKERGLSGFTDDINFIKEQKEKGVGVRPLDFITRANVDLPANQFSLSDIVRSLSDAESSYAASDMVFPKGTIKGSGLIKAIAPGFDVTTAGIAQADDQMKDMGLATTPTGTKRDFTRYVFNREGLRYSTMDTNQKLNYNRDIVVNPSSTKEQVEEAQNRLNKLTQTSIELGEDKSALEAIELRLGYMKSSDEGYDDLIEQKLEIKDRIMLREAEDEGEAGVLKAQAKIAARKGDLEQALTLTRKAEELEPGFILTSDVLINRQKEDIQRKMSGADREDYMNSRGAYEGKGYKEDMDGLRAIQTEAANFEGYSSSEFNAQRNAIYTSAKQKLAVSDPELATALKALDGDYTSGDLKDIITILGDDEKNISAFKDAIRQAVEESKNIALKNGWNTKMYDDIGNMLLADDYTSTTGSGAAASSDETVVSGGTVPADGSEVVSDETTTVLEQNQQTSVTEESGSESDEETLNAVRAKFPNTTGGAKAFIEVGLSKGKDFNTIVSEATELYGQEFAGNLNSMLDAIRNDLESTDAFSRNVLAVGESYNLNPDKSRKTVKRMADTLNISAETANALVRQALANKNRPLSFSADQATIDNVRLVLDQAGLLAMFGDGVPPQRMGKAVERVAEAFNISEEEARNKIASLSGRGEQPEMGDVTEMTDEELAEIIANPDMSNDQVVLASQELINRSKQNTETSSAEPVVTDKGTVESSVARESAISGKMKPDVIFTSMGKKIPYKKVGEDYYRIKDDGTLAASPASSARKSMLENPNRRDVEQVGGVQDVTGNAPPVEQSSVAEQSSVDMPSSDMRLSDPKAMSDAALIARYVTKDLPSPIVAEIKRRLKSNPSFVDQMKAIVDRVEKAKEGITVSNLDDETKQKVRSRTNKQRGLMGR